MGRDVPVALDAPRPRRPRMRGVLQVLAGGVLGGLLAAVVGGACLWQFQQQRLAGLAQAALRVPLARIDASNQAMDDLEALESAPCSPQHLSDMRAVVYRYDVMLDAAYIRDDRFVCSTGLGAAVAALPPLANPDMVVRKGQRVWRGVSVPMAPGTTASRVASAHYAILIRTFRYAPFVDDPYQTLTAYFMVGRPAHVEIAGGPDLGLSRPQMDDGLTFVQGGRFIGVACLPGRLLCNAVASTYAGTLAAFAYPIGATLLSGVLLGSIIAAVWQNRRRKARTLLARLRSALARNELFMVYQPIVDVRTGRIVAAEALMRWQLADGEWVPPDVFIPVAERHGLINQVTCLAMRRSLGELGDALRADPGFTLAINISSHDLGHERFFTGLHDNVVGRGIAPAQVALEITERSSVSAGEGAAALRRLYDAGYRLYIDDFGTGYSSLATLTDLTVHKLKLDRTFTSAVSSDALRARLVPTILDMAGEFGLQVIVEGVEQASEASYFESRGIFLMQGWHFGHPVSAAVLVEAMAAARQAADPPSAAGRSTALPDPGG